MYIKIVFFNNFNSPFLGIPMVITRTFYTATYIFIPYSVTFSRSTIRSGGRSRNNCRSWKQLGGADGQEKNQKFHFKLNDFSISWQVK